MKRSASTLVAGLATLSIVSAALSGCDGKKPPSDQGKNLPAITVDAAEVNGAGATFPQPIIMFWAEEFRNRTDGKVKVNYSGGGSSAGVTAVTQKLVAFGGSDAPLNAQQLAEAKAKGGDVVHIPIVIGAVVPAYNLPGIDQPLAFSGPILADIFTGKIKKWNDPKLVALNPALKEKDIEIRPVFRAEGSGTSFIFTTYLSKVSPEFKKLVGASTKPNWPAGVGIAQKGNDGIAGFLTKTPGTLGYIELTYALDSKDKLSYGTILNKAGKQVMADAPSITEAAAATLGKKQTEEPYSLHELTYDLTDAEGDKSYPISAMSFVIIFKTLEGDQAGGEKGKATVAFLKWATSAEGQAMAKARNYAPLPPELQKKIEEKLATVTVK
ncbi:MAG TPA: phosphate ABC transporter substrate-binding protein PstS [Gemmata sp.]|nr:phosphate ABC transporter substrate-binding protein PstS [Gemmata sp.]